MPKQVSLDDILTLLAWEASNTFGRLSTARKVKHLFGLSWRLHTSRLDLPEMDRFRDRVLVFQTFRRPDYDELTENVAHGMGDAAFTLQLSFDRVHAYGHGYFQKLGLSPVAKRLWQSLRRSLSDGGMWFAASRRRGFLLGTWLYLHYLKNCHDLLALVRGKPVVIVVFAEMQPLDRILSMLAREEGIPCATLQHGIYAEYNNIETVNRYNYQPLFVSDFLAWGRRTSELIARYAPHVKVHVCGKPTLKTLRRPETKAVPNYDFVVILDQNIFEAENQKMIDIVHAALGRSGMRIALRFHPQNKVEDYQTCGFETIQGDDWLQSRVCIGHTTSFLVDILQIGIPVLRYDSGAESAFVEERIEFTNAEELTGLIDTGTPALGEVLGEFISQTGPAAIQAHCEVIKSMCQRAKTSC